MTTTHLEAELVEQPAALARLLDEADAEIAALVEDLSARDVGQVLIAARGSSDNAARYAQYVLGARNRLLVALAAPSLISCYRTPPRLPATLAVGVSQSGRSPDVVGVVADARGQGCPTVALTNDAGSPLAQAADTVIALRAGPERSVAATKTYLCSLGAFALLSAHLAGDPGALAALQAVPDAVGRVLDDAIAAAEPLRALADAARWTVIGRGFNLATAFEVALKIKELTGAVAEPYSAADFLHGPIGAVGAGQPVLLVAPRDAAARSVAELVGPLRDRGARLVAITDDADLLAAADVALPLPAGTPDWLVPLLAVVPGQMLALQLALARGVEVDAPHGLSKVTETR